MSGLKVECLLNPGAFTFRGKVYLLIRTAERPMQKDGFVATPIAGPESPSGIRILEVAKDDPDLIY